ncbi:patatin-like phospholipase family protein [Hymenobacter rubidus]|uniref:patatin-like phospholipase family protein n=1 Tax=Hymenobacter rubidus TaxID=1441626 RepID=UPI00191DE1F2|nr:patatin-like phospholipase family protein [Hymenobacter rubidus]
MSFRLVFLLVGLSVLLAGPARRAQAQAAPRYRNLVMEGGGIRGIAYGGALLELEQRGVLHDIRRVGGTSAGAIQAALLAVGYSAQEVIDVVNATPVQRLNDGRFIFFGGTHRLITQYGWYRGDEFSTYLSELVARKTKQPHLTLAELHALAQKEPTRFRDLYTTGTNLTTQRVQVFSYETTPTMRVADAVRISMSIPLYFRAVLLDAQNNVMTGEPAPGQSVQVLVDGGLLANYPIDLFDYPRYLPAGLTGPTDARGHVFNPETLGLRLDRAEQIPLDSAGAGRQQLAPYYIHDFNTYVGALYTVALENLNPLLPADHSRTISIDFLNFSPKIKRISDAQKKQLMDSGRKGAQAFFNR